MRVVNIDLATMAVAGVTASAQTQSYGPADLDGQQLIHTNTTSPQRTLAASRWSDIIVSGVALMTVSGVSPRTVLKHAVEQVGFTACDMKPFSVVADQATAFAVGGFSHGLNPFIAKTLGGSWLRTGTQRRQTYLPTNIISYAMLSLLSSTTTAVEPQQPLKRPITWPSGKPVPFCKAKGKYRKMPSKECREIYDCKITGRIGHIKAIRDRIYYNLRPLGHEFDMWIEPEVALANGNYTASFMHLRAFNNGDFEPVRVEGANGYDIACGETGLSVRCCREA